MIVDKRQRQQRSCQYLSKFCLQTLNWHKMIRKLQSMSIVTNKGNIPIFKYVRLCFVSLNSRHHSIGLPRYLVSVYQNKSGKLPSPWNRVTIASLCLGNITTATASECKALFLNYSFDYQFETWLTYSLTTAALMCNVAHGVCEPPLTHKNRKYMSKRCTGFRHFGDVEATRRDYGIKLLVIYRSTSLHSLVVINSLSQPCITWFPSYIQHVINSQNIF